MENGGKSLRQKEAMCRPSPLPCQFIQPQESIKRLYLMLFFVPTKSLLSLVILGNLVGACCCEGICPARCNCSQPTVACITCLSNLFRTYNFQQKSCDCIQGFRQLQTPIENCCPANCTLCSQSLGCIKCGSNWTRTFNKEMSIYVCSCKANFFLQNGDCICLESLKPTLFFFNPQERRCKLCPTGCQCNESGCFSCNSQTFRHVINLKNYSYCPCKYPAKPNGTACRYPDNCTWSTTGLICNTWSKRVILSTNTLECLYPYQDINGSCQCIDPFEQLSIVDNRYDRECVCKSRKNWSHYQLTMENQCEICPQSCVCDLYGCSTCTAESNRLFFNSSACQCPKPLRQFSGQCDCYSPFFLSPDDGQCKCRSTQLPKLYYLQNYTCYRCPRNCTCDGNQCLSCQPLALRLIEGDPGAFQCLKCIGNATLVNNLCKCMSDPNGSKKGSCLCVSTAYYFYNLAEGTCHRCPAGCRCSAQLGCYSCEDGTFREIHTDSSANYSYCKCVEGAFVNDQEICRCVENNVGSKCICGDNLYYDNSTRRCQCRSLINPSSYFYEPATGKCNICPSTCTCTAQGCIKCQFQSLRQIYAVNQTDVVCRCLQNSYDLDGECTVCGNRAYDINGTCRPCLDCLTCDTFGGCLACKQPRKLVNKQCVCPNIGNITMINVDGQCRCPLGMYNSTVISNQTGLNQTVCINCPITCMHCISSNTTNSINGVVCLLCSSEMHRLPYPQKFCPCQDGYKQNTTVAPFCCDQKCNHCNKSGCMDCYSQFYRRINSKFECQCINNLVQINGTFICGCLEGSYFYIEVCKPCSLGCAACYFNQTSERQVCTKCKNNTNRLFVNNSCICDEGYLEASPQLDFCFLQFCKKAQTPCSACIQGRTLNLNGTQCVCLPGFFENNFKECKTCNIVGCVDCLAMYFCSECNRTEGYELVEQTCYKVTPLDQYIMMQNRLGIRVQFRYIVIEGAEPILSEMEVYLNRIRSDLVYGQIVEAPHRLTTQWCNFERDGVIHCQFNHPMITMTNVMLTIALTTRREARLVDGSENAMIETFSQRINIQTDIIYSERVAHGVRYSKILLFYRYFTLVHMIIAMALHVFGFKHNQIMFFMQTMALMAFSIKDEKLLRMAFLYNLRFAYYGFTRTADWLVPKDYLQESRGNFIKLTYDDTFFRVSGSAFMISFVVMILIVLVRSFYYCIHIGDLQYQYQPRQLIKANKKTVYRILEFFYKTLMYPMLFFSMLTFSNWNARTIHYNPLYSFINHFVSIFVIIFYLVVTLWQTYLETISRLGKIENLIEFVTVCIACAILAFTLHKITFLLLLVVFFIRALIYLAVRIYLLRDFNLLEYMKIGIFLLETFTIISLVGQYVNIITCLYYVTLTVHIIHGFSIMFVTEKMYKEKSGKHLGEQEKQVLQNRQFAAQLPPAENSYLEG